MIFDNNVVGTWVSDQGKYSYFPYFVVIIAFLWPLMLHQTKNMLRIKVAKNLIHTIIISNLDK